MMFGSVLNHFANHRHVKRWKTCVSASNTLFQDTKVAKHPFDYIGPKMMFESVSEHFTKLWHVKRCKSCVLGHNALFWVPKWRSIHSTTYDLKCGLGVFQSISLTISMSKDAKLVFRGWMHYFEVLKFWSINSTLLDPKWILGVFQTVSPTFAYKKMKILCLRPECIISWGPQLRSMHSTPLGSK
jgi:hypothetical protein